MEQHDSFDDIANGFLLVFAILAILYLLDIID
jgi:hypothetical protein